eukprot:6492628-Amphidinium_carterae.1
MAAWLVRELVVVVVDTSCRCASCRRRVQGCRSRTHSRLRGWAVQDGTVESLLVECKVADLVLRGVNVSVSANAGMRTSSVPLLFVHLNEEVVEVKPKEAPIAPVWLAERAEVLVVILPRVDAKCVVVLWCVMLWLRCVVLLWYLPSVWLCGVLILVDDGESECKRKPADTEIDAVATCAMSAWIMTGMKVSKESTTMSAMLGLLWRTTAGRSATSSSSV